jgi:hypothetical protein
MQNVDIVIKYIYFAILKSIAIRTTKGFVFVSRNMHKPTSMQRNFSLYDHERSGLA